MRFLVRPGMPSASSSRSGTLSDVVPLGEWTLPVAWLLTWLPLLALTAWLDPARAAMDGERPAAHRPAAAHRLVVRAVDRRHRRRAFHGGDLGRRGWGRGIDWLAIFPLLSIALTLFAAYGAFRVRSQRVAGLRGVCRAGAPVALLLSVRHHAAVEVRDHAVRRRRAAARGRRAAQSQARIRSAA